MSKDHLLRRLECDKRQLEKFAGRNIPKELEEWNRSIRDPSVHIASMSQQYPLKECRINCCKIALRIFQAHRVGSARALQLAKAAGADGAVAYRIEDYDAILEEKWGKAAKFYVGDSELMQEMGRRGRGRLWTPIPGMDTEASLRKYNDCVITCRAALWGMEMFDIPAEPALQVMQTFRWSNMWRNLPCPGVVAFEVEDYASRMLTRREMQHHA